MRVSEKAFSLIRIMLTSKEIMFSSFCTSLAAAGRVNS